MRAKGSSGVGRLMEVGLGAALLLSACHAGPETSGGPSPATSDDPAAERVRAFGQELGERLKERAAAAREGATLQSALEAHRPELRHPEATRSVLEADGSTPRLVRRGALTPLGEAALEALREAPTHGLDPLSVGLPGVEASAGSLAGAGASGEGPPALSDTELSQLAALLRERGIADPEQAATALLDAILTPTPEASPAPGVARWYAAHLESLEASAAKGAEAEVRLTDGLIALARALRFENPRHRPEELREQEGGDVEAARRFVVGLRQAGAQPGDAPALRAEASKQLKALAPRFEQYTRVQRALAQLRKAQAEGGWSVDFPKIPRPRPREEVVRYSRSTRKVPEGLVGKTKRFLKALGAFEGPVDDTWTDDFEQALQTYREKNQLWPRAWIDYEMVEIMKIPLDYRIAQTELTLQRWRESRIGDDPYYVFVNLPDFHAEVWDGGERKMRFRVVVGKDSRYRDKKTGEWRYPNATPLFSSRMESVVFSPYWNVPARIKLQEIDKARAKNPNYLEENNYEVVYSPNGHEMIRQKPGPGNALGKVKLLFPNDHDVYIHDTQRKDLFANPTRAYSHGCMRAEDPLALAHYVLSRESDVWTERRVRSQGGGTVESWQKLQDGPWVHIEYYTVRVSEEGDILFLDDVYELDAARLKEERGLDIGLLDP